MLSTIVFCEEKPASPPSRAVAELLARTLASLVTANVEGLLGDVRIAGPEGNDLTALANHAGCGLVEAKNETEWLSLALEAARGPEVFLLRCGQAPEAGFIEEASDFLRKNTKGHTRAACLRAVPGNFLERICPSVAPIAGLIASRDLMLRAPRSGFSKLAGFVAPSTTFHARARRVF